MASLLQLAQSRSARSARRARPLGSRVAEGWGGWLARRGRGHRGNPDRIRCARATARALEDKGHAREARSVNNTAVGPDCAVGEYFNGLVDPTHAQARDSRLRRVTRRKNRPHENHVRTNLDRDKVGGCVHAPVRVAAPMLVARV